MGITQQDRPGTAMPVPSREPGQGTPALPPADPFRHRPSGRCRWRCWPAPGESLLPWEAALQGSGGCPLQGKESQGMSWACLPTGTIQRHHTPAPPQALEERRNGGPAGGGASSDRLLRASWLSAATVNNVSVATWQSARSNS